MTILKIIVLYFINGIFLALWNNRDNAHPDRVIPIILFWPLLIIETIICFGLILPILFLLNNIKNNSKNVE